MKIDLHPANLSTAQSCELAATLRTMFRDIAHRIVRLVVRVASAGKGSHPARQCVIEVHMADGHVERIEERQRRFGAAARRAIQRAWKAAATRIARHFARRPVLRLPQPAPLLVPVPIRLQSGVPRHD